MVSSETTGSYEASASFLSMGRITCGPALRSLNPLNFKDLGLASSLQPFFESCLQKDCRISVGKTRRFARLRLDL